MSVLLRIQVGSSIFKKGFKWVKHLVFLAWGPLMDKLFYSVLLKIHDDSLILAGEFGHETFI